MTPEQILEMAAGVSDALRENIVAAELKKRTCGRCRHWEPETEAEKPRRGYCGSTQVGFIGSDPTELDVLETPEHDEAGIYTGPLFGCVHWEAKA